MLHKIEDCIYYDVCGKVNSDCPCNLIGATRIVPLIKKALQADSGDTDVAIDDYVRMEKGQL